MFEQEWKSPEIYKLGSDKDLSELLHEKEVFSVVDPISSIKEDLFDMQYPSKKLDESAREKFDNEIDSMAVNYGNWVYYPWNGYLVHVPGQDDYYDLRTFRNRNLITKNEQSILRGKKIAAFGLSVGSNVVDSSVLSGIGSEYLLFDPDRLSPTNLNRIRLIGCTGLGLYKTTITGRRIAELDPYIAQTHFSEGYDSNTDEILRFEKPDLIIEEVDDIQVKTKLRDIAKELAIPLVMVGDAGDKVILDVERHDLGAQCFNGKLNEREIESLRSGKASKRDQESVFMKLMGIQNLSPRLIESSMKRGKELGGFPQLGSTATAAGAIASVAIRDIFLDRGVRSGTRKSVDVRRIVGSRSATRLSETVQIFRDLISYRKMR